MLNGSIPSFLAPRRLVAGLVLVCSALATIGLTASPRAARGARQVRLAHSWQETYSLRAGETVEISVHLDKPSRLPANGRVAAVWNLEKPAIAEDAAARTSEGTREVDAFGIYTAPTANWRKVLHALDGDVYLIYRAPVTGSYSLTLSTVTNEPAVGATPRWREAGLAPELFPLPSRTPWPTGMTAPISVSVRPIDVGGAKEFQQLGAAVEVEPNDTPEQAQPLVLVPTEGVRTYQITGTADDIEFFDNGRHGRSGDDWFRVTLQGDQPKLFTAQLGIPGQFVTARIRTYRLKAGANPDVPLGELLPVEEWDGEINPKRLPYRENKQIRWPEGKDPNERAHQQTESYRTNISRLLHPGVTYYLRVEANAPAYQLELRVLDPAPYDDPRLAIRQAMYTHIGQVHAWLASRPRGASVDRRIRDTGNLLGTHCMSCHTHSGVWGPATPIQNGYQVENSQAFWQLVNIMYQSARPTNELKDAANNTSLAPLDIGDGPAGTRVAGYNMVNAERVIPPRRLHSKQLLRTANFVLLTNDPGGINAAGPGSNIGRNIVRLFAGEILSAAWKQTGDPRYFRKLEQKARLVLDEKPRYTDDIGHRLDFFGRVMPIDGYPAQAREAAEAEKLAGQQPEAKGDPAAAAAFVARVKAQLKRDEARLRAIQNADGSWHFNPGSSTDGGKTWQPATSDYDPSPTAVAITGLTALGYDKTDPTIAKGVQALLRMQDPNGRWNKAAITGFVPTAYVLNALARLYPAAPAKRVEFRARAGESLLAKISRVQAMALAAEPANLSGLIHATDNPNVLVRYWALIGLGALHSERGVDRLVAALADSAKPVRDAAVWALEQTLLDDHGWTQVWAAYRSDDDYTREGLVQALGMRADAVMPKSRLEWDRLTGTLAQAMNDDPNPAVRAWATKAAWQWWIWNPPVRPAINAAWVRMLEREEPNRLVEHNNRYASQALFIANGHKANGSRTHQYQELASLFKLLHQRFQQADPATKERLTKRITGIAGTFYQTSGGDGGPGQLGYVTEGAGDLVGDVVLAYLQQAKVGGDKQTILIGLEGAANIPHPELQKFLIDYALKAPEDLRKVAASSVSDARSVMLPASTELVEPLIAQVRRGALDPPRRASLSDPIIKLFGAVNWVIPKDAEQQRLFFDLMIPRLDKYVSPQALAKMTDTVARDRAAKEVEAGWYLADRLGQVVAGNPDLHHETVFAKYIPQRFANPLQRHFWVRSVPWILRHKLDLPEVDPKSTKVDPGLVVKDRALQLYLDALTPEAMPRTRALAIRIANDTAVRRNPEVLLALAEIPKFVKDDRLKRIAANVVRQGSARFVPDLLAALKKEKRPGNWVTAEGKVNPVVLQDITYFRDYVIAELARVKRSDQQACMGCHGAPGRVPSFYLRPVDEFGYISPKDLLFDYRELQARVDMSNLDRSKILRKPLNVQDGKEEGHQGGRRYLPQDAGYRILERWVKNQPKVRATTQPKP